MERTKYSPAVRNFCLRLQFHSHRAYKELRAFFDNNLPTNRTLQRWLRSVDAGPGITQLSLDALVERANSYEEQHKKQMHVCLMADEIGIMKHVNWKNDTQSFEGFCTHTNSKPKKKDRKQSDKLPVAKDALVFMVVGPGFKIPVGYFFLNGLDSIDRATITLEIIKSVDATGAKIVSLTSDGLIANVATAKYLGANFADNKPYFARPSKPQERIYVIFDVPHMLKLIRKHFASGRLFHDGNAMQWELLKILVSKQDRDNFELGNKLSRHHIEWSKTPMTVHLATETISNSVADVLEQLCHDEYEEFIGCEETIKFLRLFNNVFDAMNFGENKKADECYKQPLSNTTIEKISQLFEDLKEFVKNMEIDVVRKNKKTKVTKIYRKNVMNEHHGMGFFGFVHNCTSTVGIYNDYVRDGELDVFYTFQYSQDHLETYFSLIRSSLGANMNPTAQQFQSAYKKLLVCSPYLFAEGTNCNIYSTNVLTVSSTQQSTLPSYSDLSSQPIELELDYDFVINKERDPYAKHMCAFLASITEMNIYRKTKARNVSACQDCLNVFIENMKANDDFIARKQQTNKNLTQPCSDTMDIIYVCDEIFECLQPKKDYVPFKVMAATIFNHLDIEMLYDTSSFNSHQGNAVSSIQMTHKEEFIYTIVEEYMHIKSKKIGSRITNEEKGETIARKIKRRSIIDAGQ